ncbi:uncharacterized protein LAESUDRAFT_800851, partial [Laetiporus sulphureus 93-53]
GQNVHHWRFYLHIEDRSVLIDIVPGGDGRTGVLMVVSKPYARTRAKVALQFDVTPSPGTSVQQYIDFIIKHNLDKYKYDVDGNGCRW